MTEGMRQYAPFPTLLADLVDVVEYKPGWHVQLSNEERDHAEVHDGAAGGLTVGITTLTEDAYCPEGLHRRVHHYFPVPAATYDLRSWRRWLLDCFIKVETHEACEFFQIGGERPFAPNHGPGRDPYTIFEYSTDADRRTSFRGDVKESTDDAAKRIAIALTPGAD